jgi:prolyl oligopeptidase
MDTPAPSGSAMELPEFLGTHEGRLYLQVQDAEAPAGRIVTAPVSQPDAWETLIAATDEIINSATLAGDAIIVHSRRDVISKLRVYGLDGSFRYEIELPGPGSAFGINGHPERDELHFGFDSLAYPQAILQHDLSTGTTTRVAEAEVPFDREAFITRQVFVSSSGGVKVPVFIAHRADLELPAPTMLTDYGIGGIVSDPLFSPTWGAWLQHGGVVALGNIRGGGAYGAEWAAAGTRERRQNTHADFIAIAEMLIDEAITTKEQLATQSDSAGGMMIASVMAQRPDLFAAVQPGVAVLDLVRFASFTAGARMKAVVGDPMVPSELPWLLDWSPYHNLHPGTCYPATLIDTAVNDDLVHPSQSYKFAARLQAVQGCDNPVILSVAETGGHYGPDDLNENFRAIARRFAFMAAKTGLILKD